MAVYVIASLTIKDTVRFEDYRRTVLPTMQKYCEADFIPSDLRDVSSVREVARKAVELGNGHVDILINNVGLFPFGPTQQTTEEMFDSVYSLNVKAPYFLVGELAPLMAKRGKGTIVNVSTMVADYGVSMARARPPSIF